VSSPSFIPSAALREGIASLNLPRVAEGARLSESSIDATLLLHSIGYEPVDFVFAVAAQSFPFQVWNSGPDAGFKQFPQGPVPKATAAFDTAFARAKEVARRRAASVGALGVVDTSLLVTVRERHILVEVRGTAIRRLGAPSHLDEVKPFVSDLSARSLVGLVKMGFFPSDYVAGYGFSTVSFMRRAKFTQNAEIATMTQAVYESREAAMERLQSSAKAKDVVGVVGIRTHEHRNLNLNIRIVTFRATGTTIVRRGTTEEMKPQVILGLNDSSMIFDPIVSHRAEESLGESGQQKSGLIARDVTLSARRLARSRFFVGHLSGDG
jgi:uncharacterized protein YbjQ (UPF0145 family)